MLTAHPTEINRRTLLAKHQDVARRLEELEVIQRAGGPEKVGRFEADQAKKGLMRAVEALWNSDEVRGNVAWLLSTCTLLKFRAMLTASALQREVYCHYCPSDISLL